MIDVLERAREATGSALVIITHDLGVVARIAHRILVMYAGRAAETGMADGVFERPSHPYTAGLLGSIPRLDAPKGTRLMPIDGAPPSMLAPPPGCAFAPRCPRATPLCSQEIPELRPIGNQQSACHHGEDQYNEAEDV